MAAASIDEVCSIKVARRRILDWIGSELNVLEKLLEEATDLLRRKIRSLCGKAILGKKVEDRTESRAWATERGDRSQTAGHAEF